MVLEEAEEPVQHVGQSWDWSQAETEPEERDAMDWLMDDETLLKSWQDPSCGTTPTKGGGRQTPKTKKANSKERKANWKANTPRREREGQRHSKAGGRRVGGQPSS